MSERRRINARVHLLWAAVYQPSVRASRRRGRSRRRRGGCGVGGGESREGNREGVNPNILDGLGWAGCGQFGPLDNITTLYLINLYGFGSTISRPKLHQNLKSPKTKKTLEDLAKILLHKFIRNVLPVPEYQPVNHIYQTQVRCQTSRI
jgi:hypothetical protein